MPRLKKEQIITAVYQQIEDSEGYDSDELNGLRKDALDYYYNRPSAAPSMEGRSSIQSSDVADMVEAVVSQIMPAFETESVAEFEPISEEDVDQARTESNAVNWVIMQQNNGFYEIQQAVRDALLLRNGVMKVYLDEKIDIKTENYAELTELEYGELIAGSVEDISLADNGIKVETLSEENGFYDVRVTSKRTIRKVKSCAIDPSNFSWERDHDSIYLQDARFVCERSLPTRSDLIKMGYKKSLVNSLNAGGNDTQIDTLARNQHSQRRNWRGATKAEDIIECFECYIRIDADGDGEAELLKVVVADKKILEMQDMQYIPYASGTPFLQPHRFNGLGLFDKLRYIQDAKTATMRQMLDNQNHANNARVIMVDGGANPDDLMNSRPGGVIRATAPGMVEPFPFTDIGPSCQNTLSYLDKVRSERGGASLDLQSAELQLAGETAHGIERQMSAKEQLAAMMCRTLAETLIRSTFDLVHTALRLYIPEQLSFRVSGQFATASPSEWRERESISIQAGLSLAERTRKAATLDAITTNQSGLVQGGYGYMVGDKAMYHAALDGARAQGIKNPERYYTDPQSDEAMQSRQAQAQQQQEQAAYQQMLLDMQREIENRNADNADAKIMEDARQFDENLQFEYWKVNQDNALTEADMTKDVALKLMGGSDEQEGAGAASAGQ